MFGGEQVCKTFWVVKLIRFVSLNAKGFKFLFLFNTKKYLKLSKNAKWVFKVLAKCCVWIYLCDLSLWTPAKPKKDNGLLWHREWTPWWSALVQINEASAELRVCSWLYDVCYDTFVQLWLLLCIITQLSAGRWRLRSNEIIEGSVFYGRLTRPFVFMQASLRTVHQCTKEKKTNLGSPSTASDFPCYSAVKDPYKLTTY